MKKSMIPNLLTLIRICLVPLMIILSIFKLYKIAIFFVIVAALTDLVDGKLARYWHVTSIKGAKLDDIADKVFSIGLLLYLSSKHKMVIPMLILDILLATTNLYYHKKTNITETLMIGKIKTTFLFTTIVIFFISNATNNLTFLNSGFTMATINLQIMCLISYYINYYKNTHKMTVEDSMEHKNIMNDNTIVLDNIQDLYKYMNK